MTIAQLAFVAVIKRFRYQGYKYIAYMRFCFCGKFKNNQTTEDRNVDLRKQSNEICACKETKKVHPKHRHQHFHLFFFFFFFSFPVVHLFLVLYTYCPRGTRTDPPIHFERFDLFIVSPDPCLLGKHAMADPIR